MRTETKLAVLAWREVPLADFIPYSTHVTDHVIKTREGDYLCIWRIAGIAFEAADPADILVRHEGLNQLIRGLAGGPGGLWGPPPPPPGAGDVATPYGPGVSPG